MTFSQHSELSMRKNATTRLSTLAKAITYGLAATIGTGQCGETTLVWGDQRGIYEYSIVATPRTSAYGETHTVSIVAPGKEILEANCYRATPTKTEDFTYPNHSYGVIGERVISDSEVGSVHCRGRVSQSANSAPNLTVSYSIHMHGGESIYTDRTLTLTVPGVGEQTTTQNGNPTRVTVNMPTERNGIAKLQYADHLALREAQESVLHMMCTYGECLDARIMIECTGEACGYIEYRKNGQAVHGQTVLSAGETLYALARMGPKGNMRGSITVIAAIV